MQVLNEEQAEAEAIFGEEVGEALQAMGKLKRFGFTAVDGLTGDTEYDNLEDFSKELADIIAAMVLLQYVGLFFADNDRIMDAVKSKCMKMALRFQSISGRDFMRHVLTQFKEAENARSSGAAPGDVHPPAEGGGRDADGG
jgi:NTP pyrophosphatase (non-canonical NTP hydrolase)